MTVEERFEKFFSAGDGCWIWKGSRIPSGYGMFRLNGKTRRAHRVSWQLYVCRTIPKGMVIMHTCDNPSCVRPEHLRIGTQLENMRDAKFKGRYAKTFGANNPNARLTPQQVATIRSLYIPGKKGLMKTLASRFGINRSQVLRIGNGEAWPQEAARL